MLARPCFNCLGYGRRTIHKFQDSSKDTRLFADVSTCKALHQGKGGWGIVRSLHKTNVLSSAVARNGGCLLENSKDNHHAWQKTRRRPSWMGGFQHIFCTMHQHEFNLLCAHWLLTSCTIAPLHCTQIDMEINKTPFSTQKKATESRLRGVLRAPPMPVT